MVTYVKRLFKILYSFSLYFWHAFVCIKRNTPENLKKRAVLLRQTLEELGSVFIKFGQFLSLRSDFIPIVYCRELFYLLDKVPPFSKEEVTRIFKEEFNTTPDKLYSSFKMESIAAASFGQVHEAYLKNNNNDKVAVKVQRPGIKELVNQDLRLMKLLAKLIDFFPLGPNKLQPMIDQFETWTLEELDYITEAKYTEEFYQYFKNHDEQIISPKIYRQFCSSRILTAEFIEGVTLSNVLLAVRKNDQTFLNKISQVGFCRRKVAETLLKNSVKQIYFDGFFHADPHPANIIFTPDKKLAYIDFGIIGKLDKKTRFACLRYSRSALYGDSENAFDALLLLCDITETTDLVSFKKEHDQIIQESLDQFKKNEISKNPQGFTQILGQKLVKTMALLQKYKVIVPPDTLRYFRALSTLDSTITELYPEMKLDKIAKKFRNISIANLIMELPSIMSYEELDKHLLKWLNIIEKELFTTPGVVRP